MKYYPAHYRFAPLAKIEMDALDSGIAFFSPLTQEAGVVLIGAAGGLVQPWYAYDFEWSARMERKGLNRLLESGLGAAAAQQLIDRTTMNGDPPIVVRLDGELGFVAFGRDYGWVDLWEVHAGDVGTVEEVRDRLREIDAILPKREELPELLDDIPF